MCDNCDAINTLANKLYNAIVLLLEDRGITDINDKELDKLLFDLDMTKDQMRVLGVFD